MSEPMPGTVTTTADRNTPNLPAVRTDSALDKLARLGTWLAATEKASDPKGRDGMAGALRFYYAEQLGLPATAVAELSVIHGRLFIGAPLMRHFAEKAGYRILREASTDESCTAALVVARTGERLGEATFTIEEARRAGLIKPNSNWQTYPKRMLWQRASSYVIRDFAPSVALGLATTDEIPEYTGAAESAFVAEHTEEYADFVPIEDPDLERIEFGEPAPDDEPEAAA